MTATLIIVVLALISIYSFKVGKSSIVCNNGKEATVSDSTISIRMVLCADDDMAYLDITYPDYSDVWFGVVFSSNMIGDSAIYTTGKADNRALAMYAYDLQTRAISGSGVIYDGSIVWTEELVDTTNGIQVIYKTALSNYGFTTSTESISIRYAYGSSTTLEHHQVRSNTPQTLDFTVFPATTTLVPTTAAPITATPTSANTTTSAPTATPTTTTAAPVDVCNNGNEATVSGNIMSIRMVLCADDDMVYLDITYPDYSDGWFGVVFSDIMIGDSAVYTTGKANDRALAMYAYELKSKVDSGVLYNGNILWTEVLVDTTNGMQVIYKTALSNYGFTTSTESISIRYAYGTSTQLAYHGFGEYSSTLRLDFTGLATTTPTTTTATTTAAQGSKGCDAQELVPTTATLDDFTVTFFLNCDDDTVTVIIEYSGYDDNWFGVVFSEDMIGNALVYTTGKSGSSSPLGLYPYTLTGRGEADVTEDSDNLWEEISTTTETGTITVEYKQDLSKTSFTRETEEVPFRWAKGGSLTLAYHGSDGRSSTGANLDLLTGTSSTITDDLTAQIAHGIIMWFAWAILASWGIMSSRFRWLYPKGPIWFKIHRGVQAFVVILDIAGFIIAVVFTAQRRIPHFSNLHMKFGLVVTILAILQPINAYFRAHPPADGWPNGKKPMKRIVWEWIHKGFGYIAWILGLVTITKGLQLLGEDLLAKLHAYVWCGLMLVAFIILSIVGYLNAKKEAQVEMVPSNMNEDDPDGVITTR